MDTALAHLHDRLSTLEQENTSLRSRLQSCERSHAVLQAEVAGYRQRKQDEQESAIETIAELPTPNGSSLERGLLEAIAEVANALLTIAPFDAAVNTALQIIGEALDTDRVCLIENFAASPDSPFPNWRILQEWDSPGTVSQLAHTEMTQGSWAEIEQWYELCSQGQSVSCLLENMPQQFRRGSSEIGIKVLHIVPIFVESKWWGVIGFDDCREVKHRSVAELSILKIAADCIGSAIQQNRTQQALLQAEQKRAAELAKANEELQQRDRLLETTVIAANTLLTIAPFDQAVNTALQILGESLDTDRVKILECFFNNSSNLCPAYYSMSYEWITAGTIPQISHPSSSRISIRGAEEFMERLYQSGGFGGLLCEWPEVFWNAFEAVQAKAIYCVPIRVKGQLWGVLVFDDCHEAKQRNLSELSVLRIAADCIGSAIQRDRNQQALLQAEQARSQELAKANDALKQTVDVLATETDLDRFLGHVLQVIATQLDAPLTEYWYHPEPNNIAYVGLTCWQGQILKPEEQPGHVGLLGYPVPPEMIHRESLHQRRSHFITEDIAASTVHTRIANEFGLDARAWYEPQGVSRLLNVPLILGDKTIGALIVFLPSDRHFTEQQIELTYALAQQVTLAIQLTRLAEETKQAAIAREQEKAAQERAAELAKANEALKRSLNSLATDQSLDRFLANVMTSLAEQFNSTTAEYWSHPDGETAYIELLTWEGALYSRDAFANIHPDHPGLAGYKVPPEMILNEPLNRRTQHFIIEDSSIHPDSYRRDRQWMYDHGIPKEINIPLNVGENTIGAFVVRMSQDIEITNEKVELAWALANQVALALELTRLAEEAKQAAIYEERNRMASEIHDTLAQAFTGISLQLEVAKSLVEEDAQAVQQILNHISQLAEAGLSEARRSVWALYPPAAEYADLAQLLYESVEQMTRSTAITVEVNVQGTPCCLPPFLGMNLLRIGQEALTNALKHAQAEIVTIELAYEPDRILLTIRDNGRGFTPPDTIDNLNGGFGLMGMYERCDRIGAQLSLTSQPGQGTQILVEAPLA